MDTSAEFETALSAFAPDLILSDYTLPGFDGTEALQIAHALRPDTPFIFVSGTIGFRRGNEHQRRAHGHRLHHHQSGCWLH